MEQLLLNLKVIVVEMWLRSESDLFAASSSAVSDASVSASSGLRPYLG